MIETAVQSPRNRNEFLRTEHLKGDLKGRSVRGGAATLVGQGATFVAMTTGTMILARLLTPADFGLIAMVTAVTGLASLFKDLGLSMATVQRAEVSHEQISTLFWVNVGMGSLIAMTILVLAPIIAWFYGDSRLMSITVALSCIFALGGLTVQHQALMRRQMRFGVLASIAVISLVVGEASAVVAALVGCGYWSLVIMHITIALANTVAVWIACPWLPSLPTRHTGTRGMLAFGANLTGFNILNYLARNLDHILIGRAWGPQSLGLYAKAYGLLLLPMAQITHPIASVAIPALSRLQNEPEEYRHYYYRAINVIAFITMPVVLLLAALSKEVIVVILGDRWIDAAPLFKVLAFASLTQSVVSPVGWVYVSLGQTSRMMQWGLFAVPITVISFLVGLPRGAWGVAVSYTICSLTLLTLPCLWWAFRYSPLTIGQWFSAVRCPLLASLTMYGVVEVLHGTLHVHNPVWAIVLLGLMGLCVLIVVAGLWREARTEAFRAMHLLKALRVPGTT